MSLRQLTRQESHFLVQYLCDKKFQVRSRGFIRGEDPVTIGANYDVQWGSQRQVDEAGIINSGSEKDMKSSLRQKQNVPTGGRQKTTVKPKQPASVVARGRGQIWPTQESTIPHTLASPDEEPAQEPANGGQPSQPLADQPTMQQTDEQTTDQSDNDQPTQHSTEQITQQTNNDPHQQSAETPGLISCRPIYRVNRTQCAATPQMMASFINAVEVSLRQGDRQREKMLRTMESQARLIHKLTEEVTALRGLVDGLVQTSTNNRPSHISAELDSQPGSLNDITEGLPEQYRISEEDLRGIHGDSNNVGHFAAMLVWKLFPELYGPTNLRFHYNWYGGGQKKKSELDVQRKQVIQRYVTFFHPEVSDSDVWRDRVVPKINESLRRMEKRRQMQENVEDVNINVTPSTFAGLLSYLNL